MPRRKKRLTGEKRRLSAMEGLFILRDKEEDQRGKVIVGLGNRLLRWEAREQCCGKKR